MPVLFLQLGKAPKFIDEVLRQAQHTNGHDNVYFLTDTDTRRYKTVNCIDIAKYAGLCRAFGHIYKHHSSNEVIYEKACIERWLIVNAVIKELGITHFFYADCDVLVMEDLYPIQHKIIAQGHAGGLIYFDDGREVSSAHSSFWSAALLEEFCGFINDTYADNSRFEALLAHPQVSRHFGKPHISDMTLIEYFRNKTETTTLNLLTLQNENCSFDVNLNIPDNGIGYNYEMDDLLRIKKLTTSGGSVYGRATRRDGVQVTPKFYTLHFQNFAAKLLIPAYVYWPNKVWHAVNDIYIKARYLYKRWKWEKKHGKPKR